MGSEKSLVRQRRYEDLSMNRLLTNVINTNDLCAGAILLQNIYIDVGKYELENNVDTAFDLY